MKEDDFYAILGVLPDAEDVVIVGAYRALAQRYHPDRWAGDPSEAHRRMSHINRAYGVLSDAIQRAAYNKLRARSQQAEFTQNDDYGDAFTNALAGVEGRWKIACDVYPDLRELRANLDRISTALAFAFVTTLLETKTFPTRAQVAAHLERAFLERYFGSNPEIVEYARRLIFAGQKAAAKALNLKTAVTLVPRVLAAGLAGPFGR